MNTQPLPRDHQAEQRAQRERQLKQERIDLIRAMAARIDSPEIVESHCSALVKLQERLDELRTQHR